MRRFAKIHPVTLFYVLAFAVAWAGWAPLVAVSRGLLPSTSGPLLKSLLVFPAVAPALAAAIVLRLAPPQDTGENLLRSYLRYRVSSVWYVLATALPAIILLSSRAIESFIGAPAAPSLPPGTPADVAGILVLSVLANPWEEVGWRGFALPHLQARYGSLTASLLIGCFSGFWHLPMFYLVGSPMSAYPYLPWFVACVGTAVIAAWLFNGAGRSLLLVTIFHVALNVWSVAIGIRSFYSYAGVNTLCAMIVGAHLIRRRLHENNLGPAGNAAESHDAADVVPTGLLSLRKRWRG